MRKKRVVVKDGLNIRERIGRGFRYIISHSVFGPITALILVSLVFIVGTGGSFLSLKNLQNILSLGSILAMTVFGSSLVILMGAIDLSPEGVIALCAVIGGLIMKNERTVVDVGFWAIPIVMMVGAGTGLINGTINTKLKVPSLITTLGMWFAALGIAVIFSGGSTNPIMDSRLQVLANGSLFGIPYITMVTICVFIVLAIIEKRTAIGKYIFAIGGNEILAKQVGINVERVKVIVFSIAGSLYGMTGFFLVARLLSANPTISRGILFPAITATVVGGTALSGGIGGVVNALIGAMTVTVLRSGMVLMNISPYVQGAVNGVVLILAVTITMDRKKISIIK